MLERGIALLYIICLLYHRRARVKEGRKIDTRTFVWYSTFAKSLVTSVTFTIMTTRIELNGTRFLNIDGVVYPSVSNISNAFSPKMRHTSRNTNKTASSVGGAETVTSREEPVCAVKLKAENTHRGIQVHQLLADGTLEHSDSTIQTYLNHYQAFERKHLKVYERESQVVFYDKGSGLRFAGAMDVLGEFRHKLCVADYKVSVKPKQLKHCFSFFLQVAGYALAYEQTRGVIIPTGSIINIHKYGVKTFHLSTVNFTYFKQSFLDAAIAYLRYQDALTMAQEAKTPATQQKILAKDFFDWNAYVENSPLLLSTKEPRA